MPEKKTFSIIKKVAKQGKQHVILVPKLLEKQLKPGTVAKITIEVLDEVI